MEEEIEPDQGFTRPALLILTPFRSQALKWLSALSSSLPGKIEGEDRYKREFGLPDGASDKLKDAPKGVYAEDHVEVSPVFSIQLECADERRRFSQETWTTRFALVYVSRSAE